MKRNRVKIAALIQTLQNIDFMKNKIALISLFLTTLLAGCERNEEKQVKYLATGSVSEYSITYRATGGNLVTETVEAQSQTDKWSYSFVANQGEILYLSGFYKDVNSGLKLMVLVDGKVYKQSSSLGDTISYLIVSGVVPY